MRSITLDRRTRRIVRSWTAASIGFTLLAVVAAVGAGGTSQWSRLLLGGVAVAGFGAATRFRVGLAPGVLAGAAMVGIVPDDASADRTVATAVGALALLGAAEAAHLARRHITIAPVTSSRRDLVAFVRLLAVAAMAMTGVAAVAQLERLDNRWAVVAVAAGAAVIAVAVARSARVRHWDAWSASPP